MAGALRKTMVYLGLAEEDERYDGYDDHYEDVEPDDGADHRADRASDRGAQVTHLPPRQLARVVPTSTGEFHRITTIHPRAYNDAKAIGESFREGVPVIMNLTDMDDSDAKRLVDFAAGLVFGLHGAIERVTNKVFLLSPAGVEVTAEDKEPSAAGPGFFNQS